MNKTAQEFHCAYKNLYQQILDKSFLTDKSGCLFVELLSPRIVLSIDDELDGYVNFETRKSPLKYIEKELVWYDSHSTKIDLVDDVKIWKECANSNNEINSNYGNLVFSKQNFSQFAHVVETLKNHKDSRQGIIIYTRPSIQVEWNDLGGRDFICTNFQHFLIRNDKLFCVINMRSQDCIYGTFSDTPWFFTVYKRMLTELKKTYPTLSYGNMIMTYNSFHCYEQHFDILAKIANETIK